MGKRLVVVLASGIVAAAVTTGLGVLPASAELVPGGWAEPIPVPPARPPAPDPALQRPPPRVPHVPVRRRVHRHTAPASPALPNGQVRF